MWVSGMSRESNAGSHTEMKTTTPGPLVQAQDEGAATCQALAARSGTAVLRVGLDDNADPDADPAVITGYKAARTRPLTPGWKLSSTVLATVRAPVEHGFAYLKHWRALTKLRTDSKSATALLRALLVLTNREIAR